jgi:hypothetical protein
MHGLQSVRAFQAEDRQLTAYLRFVNKNASAQLTFLGISRWLSVRLDSSTSLLLLGLALFAVTNRGQLSAGILGVALTQGLQVRRGGSRDVAAGIP